MTAPSKRTTAQVWQALEATAGEVELARIAALDDEALDRELKSAGIDPREAADVGEDVLRAASADAPVPGAAASRPRGVDLAGRPEKSRGRSPLQARWVAALAVAAIALLVLTALAKRREIEAWLGPAHIEKDREAPPREPSPRERAAKIREDAYAACADWLWAKCRRTLDEAQKLDPAGEQDPRVQAARDAVRRALELDGGTDRKPPR